MDFIFPFIVSLLPPPVVPAPEADSDSDDERFSLTSSSSSDASVDPPAFLPAAPGDGEDHISRLPDTLLSDIISRLPTKEAARTVALSTRWRGVWAATPLVVDDAHLAGDEGICGIPTMRAVSRCVDAHPGPVRGVRLTRISFYDHEYALWRLVAALAAKEVRDLILFNRPWPLNMPLPDDVLFRCASLERLYLGVWHIPKITAGARPRWTTSANSASPTASLKTKILKPCSRTARSWRSSLLSWVTTPRRAFVSCPVASRSLWSGCLTLTRSSSRTHPVSSG
ncbi:hypothetical protein PR202_ga10604 [Eleusine coracana subsp. coracana]|uniref:F-box domain-containing protein n=1 Tax=Eleusine coracana subsp. coracana TaxID=191504 RepID=A0AAV5C792_ELECO|nr:hypothetical protein PR202_ga10604 [Eleusine coracana subsp. coracana]